MHLGLCQETSHWILEVPDGWNCGQRCRKQGKTSRAWLGRRSHKGREKNGGNIVFRHFYIPFCWVFWSGCYSLYGSAEQRQKGELRSCIASFLVHVRLTRESRVTTEVLDILQTLNFHCFFFSRCPGWPWQPCQLFRCYWWRHGCSYRVLGQFSQNLELTGSQTCTFSIWDLERSMLQPIAVK